MLGGGGGGGGGGAVGKATCIIFSKSCCRRSHSTETLPAESEISVDLRRTIRILSGPLCARPRTPSVSFPSSLHSIAPSPILFPARCTAIPGPNRKESRVDLGRKWSLGGRKGIVDGKGKVVFRGRWHTLFCVPVNGRDYCQVLRLIYSVWSCWEFETTCSRHLYVELAAVAGLSQIGVFSLSSWAVWPSGKANVRLVSQGRGFNSPHRFSILS